MIAKELAKTYEEFPNILSLYFYMYIPENKDENDRTLKKIRLNPFEIE